MQKSISSSDWLINEMTSKDINWIDLRLTKFIPWSDFEKRKIEKEYVQLLEDARIYYIVGKKTPNDEEILYIGSTNKNITNRIKFNHRGFV